MPRLRLAPSKGLRPCAMPGCGRTIRWQPSLCVDHYAPPMPESGLRPGLLVGGMRRSVFANGGSAEERDDD